MSLLAIFVASQVSLATTYVDVQADAAVGYFNSVGNWWNEDDHWNSSTVQYIGSVPWLSSTYKFTGTDSLAVKIPASDSNPLNVGDKSEYTFVRITDDFVLKFGETRYFSFAMRLGGDSSSPFDTPDKWLLISQIWQVAAPAQPPIAVYIVPNSNPLQIRVYVRDDDDLPYNDWENGTQVYEGTINKRQWYEITYKLVPSYKGHSGTGQISMWIDGDLLFDYIGDWGYKPESEGGVAGVENKILCKAGLYRRQQEKTQVMFIDDIKYADSSPFLDPVESLCWKMNHIYSTTAYYSEPRNYIENASGGNPLLILGRPIGGGGIYNPILTTNNGGYTGIAGDEALDFDGTNNFAHSLGAHHAWNNAWKDTFEVSFYFNPNQIDAGRPYQDIIVVPNAWTVRLVYRGNGFAFFRFVVTQTAGGEAIAVTDDFLVSNVLGEWNHVIVTAGNNVMNISINGTAGTNMNFTTMVDSIDDRVYLGASSSYTYPYSGLLDEVVINGVPEPATIILFGCATLILFFRKK